MPRIDRGDAPDTWHHVMNRAISRRTLFETKLDFRCFLAHLALETRRGTIELHAFCLMGTHFHLVVRSLVGRLAEAMQRVQLAYSRWFNRSRGRDGSLVRGRYLSKRVRSLEYRRILVRYIDHNPCAARLVDRSSEYPWGSAWHYARGEGPRWLERTWIEARVRAVAGRSRYRPEDYLGAFPPGHGLAGLVEARIHHAGGEDALDDLVASSSEHVREWMRSRALLADGTQPGLPVLTMQHLVETIDCKAPPEWSVRRGRTSRAGAELALVGLGRDLCGQRMAQLADHIRASETRVRRLYALHRKELLDGGEYAQRVARLARAGVARMRGGPEPGSTPHTRAGVRR